MFHTRTTRVSLLALMAFALIPTLFVLGADKDKDDKKDDPAFDSVFLKDAAQRVLGEIELCRLVDERSHSEGVKHYASLQISHFRELLEDTRNLASARDVKLPTDLSDHQKTAMKQIAKE